jgi:hypothetical protein
MTQQDQSVDRITAANAMRGQLADRMGPVLTCLIRRPPKIQQPPEAAN